MKQLTLEHMSAYLPFDVKIDDGHKTNYTLTAAILVDTLALQHKLVLRPLSDVLKPIKDEKGKTFVIARVLWSVEADEEEAFDVYGTIPEYWKICMAELQQSCYSFNYYDVVRLCKYHFDVFGLIEQGLATIKT